MNAHSALLPMRALLLGVTAIAAPLASMAAPLEQRLLQDDETTSDVEVVCSAFEAWATGTGGPYQLLDDDARWTIVGRSAAAGVYPDRAAFMRLYDHFMPRLCLYLRGLGLPIGSGVTEAACKTVFTQRLKLSGMRWSGQGAQTVLNLRVLLLSGLWDDVYAAGVNSYNQTPIRTPRLIPLRHHKNAA